MCLVKQAVEWRFHKILRLFVLIRYKKNVKLFLQDVETLLNTSVILTNCHTRLYGSVTAQYFNIPAITLEEYLGVGGWNICFYKN